MRVNNEQYATKKFCLINDKASLYSYIHCINLERIMIVSWQGRGFLVPIIPVAALVLNAIGRNFLTVTGSLIVASITMIWLGYSWNRTKSKYSLFLVPIEYWGGVLLVATIVEKIVK
jgi:hypothetical protein